MIVGDDEGGGRVEGPEESPAAVFLLGFGSRLLLLSTNQLPPLIRGPAMIYRSVLFVYLSSFLLPTPSNIHSFPPTPVISEFIILEIAWFSTSLPDAFYSGKSA